MARPTKNGDERRAVIVRIRVTLAEKERLDAKALEAGLTLSDWIRNKSIGSKPLLKRATPEREVLLRFLAAYGHIGSNINQIARQLNRKQDSEGVGMSLVLVTHAIAEIRTITSQLRDTLDNHGIERKDSG